MDSKGATKLGRDDLRRICQEARAKEKLRDKASGAITDRLIGMGEFKDAETVYVYVNLPTEVETRNLIKGMLKTKKIAVPYTKDDVIRLFRLKGLDELEPGVHNVLEPKKNLRTKEREMKVEDIDLFIMPGVAFDERGNRLGFGRGYHDRMLKKARADAVKIGLAYECQMVEEIPATPTDIPVDYVITEKKTVKC